jgi:hypothetical protein
LSDLGSDLALLSVVGALGSLNLTSTTSLSRQEAITNFDASPPASRSGGGAPVLIEDKRKYRVFDQEIRVGKEGGDTVDWLAGISFVDARTRARISAHDAQPLFALDRSISEAAVFGELTYRPTATLKLSGGARVFSSQVDEEGGEVSGAEAAGKRHLRVAGSLSVDWSPSVSKTFFVRAASAFRPGGTNFMPGAPERDFAADELASIEAGGRFRFAETWSAETTLYAARWTHVQADALLDSGLVATANVGDALNFGVESGLKWTPRRSTMVGADVIFQSSRLDGRGTAIAIDDRRLPVVPQLAARLRAAQGFVLAGWSGQIDAAVRYTGATHLSFDPVLDRRTGPHLVADASLTVARGEWSLMLAGENLSNSSADTFGFGNPYRLKQDPQRAPLRPRTVALSVTRKF